MINDLILSDLNEIISDKSLPISLLEDKTILITGATGLIGSLFIKTLLHYCSQKNKKIKIIALAKNPQKFKSTFSEYLNDTNLLFVEYDKFDSVNLPNCDYILHTACITDSHTITHKPYLTINTIISLTNQILQYTLKTNAKILYLSSMEVYGKTSEEEVKESAIGEIELLRARSSYPQAKRLAELMCYSAKTEYNIQTVIARPTLTFGIGMPITDNRVISQFIKSVIKNENIILHTEGLSKRDYLYTTDAIKALIFILIYGKSGEAYNISNPETYTSIYELAERCISLFNKKSKVIIDKTYENNYPPTVKTKLNISKLLSLGWKPIIDLNQALQKTKLYFENIENS